MDKQITTINELQWTGERYLPEVHGGVELEHVHRYLIAKKYVVGKRVLDIASGEGYGSSILAHYAKSVIGVDIAPDAVVHASKKYQAKNLKFELGSCNSIPIPDSSIDVVVSFETIEHHDQHDEMLSEIKRVLMPNGILIISSPDKAEYSDRPNYQNPYHVKELYKEEFEKLIQKYFVNYKIAGQKVIYGSSIFGTDKNCQLSFFNSTAATTDAAKEIKNAVYLIAVASNSDIPNLDYGILEQPITRSDIVASLDSKISGLRDEITALRGEIAVLQNTVIELEENLHSIYESKSWRYTMPLRKITATLLKIAKRQ